MSGSYYFSAGTRHVVPHKEGTGSQPTVMSSLEQVTSHAKEIPNQSVHRQESLRVSGGFEPSHLSFALAGRLMRDFGSIVLVLLRAVNNRGHHEAVGRRVTAQRVRDQTSWRTALPFQQLPKEAHGRPAITSGLHKHVDHVAVVVDRPPEVLLPTLDGHEQFVQVPGVAQASSAPSERTRVLRTEGPTPLPNRLVGDGDAPLSEEIFGIAEAQTEPVVVPDGVTNDVPRESVPW